MPAFTLHREGADDADMRLAARRCSICREVLGFERECFRLTDEEPDYVHADCWRRAFDEGEEDGDEVVDITICCACYYTAVGHLSACPACGGTADLTHTYGYEEDSDD